MYGAPDMAKSMLLWVATSCLPVGSVYDILCEQVFDIAFEGLVDV